LGKLPSHDLPLDDSLTEIFREEHKRPFIDPTTVFKRLEDYEHDILSILDTCYAADVTKSSGTKVYTKELLTATNVEIAKAGPLSFTKTLVSILEKSDKADVLQIFDKLVLREGGHHCHHVFYPVTGSHTPILLHSIVPGEQVVEEVATPKVEHEYTALIAVKMSGGHGEVTEWIDYITKDVPKPVIGVKIEKVWGSTSILLLIRLPIRVYCMLPVKFAYTFIAYVSEEIHHEESPPEKTLEVSTYIHNAITVCRDVKYSYFGSLAVGKPVSFSRLIGFWKSIKFNP